MEFKRLEPAYDSCVAQLIRRNLESYHLDIPGTAYFDEGLDHLSEFYDDPKRAYFVLIDNGKVIGGVGLAEFTGFDECCELQKLYLEEEAKGKGLGYDLIAFIEEQARTMGYRSMYLETHDNLQPAIHIYEKTGYQEIKKPESVVHSTMNRFYYKELEGLTGA